MMHKFGSASVFICLSFVNIHRNSVTHFKSNIEAVVLQEVEELRFMRVASILCKLTYYMKCLEQNDVMQSSDYEPYRCKQCGRKDSLSRCFYLSA